MQTWSSGLTVIPLVLAIAIRLRQEEGRAYRTDYCARRTTDHKHSPEDLAPATVCT